MEPQKPSPESRQSEGCLVVAIRIPVRIVVLVLVVPVRVVWDGLVVVGRFLPGTLLRPRGRALARVAAGLWRYVLVPVGGALGWLGRVLVVVPAAWLHRSVLTPLGRYLFVVPARWLCARVLAPVATAVGLAVYGALRVVFVLPALALWRWVLAPVGRVLAVVAREAGEALSHAWRVAGRLSRAVGRLLGTLVRWILVESVRRVYRSLLTPVGRLVRDAVLRPAARGARAVGRAVRGAPAGARDTVRQVRADVRRALFGEPRQPAAVDRREPQGPAARTLGSSTTALTKD
ncbi:hypothetical protein [Streptomyces monashensis]|uniref:Uncharacterized protein n=1 Tax=Streptomyces monashensis TaxID=1678012 RepID=A0A1S2PR01_9ACTN|nr:hypothetical protein [Streptomyces monashensis]OIJ95835.1 hypothetical protein BIV23_33520 [Streptomyces monashensis]